MTLGDRIAVVGSSGSGKSTLARELVSRGYAHLELDALAHQENWQRSPDPEMRGAIVDFIQAHGRWVVDGNYERFRNEIWSHVDTIVWLDLDRRTVMSRLLRRSLGRLLLRKTLWNGNRERWRDVLSRDPERSVLMWAWTRFDGYRAAYERLMSEPRWSALTWVRLRTTGEVHALLERQ